MTMFGLYDLDSTKHFRDRNDQQSLDSVLKPSFRIIHKHQNTILQQTRTFCYNIFKREI